jgi:hypothetical protein
LRAVLIGVYKGRFKPSGRDQGRIRPKVEGLGHCWAMILAKILGGGSFCLSQDCLGGHGFGTGVVIWDLGVSSGAIIVCYVIWLEAVSLAL